MARKRETIARIGIGTKGAVYCLIGLLAALAAFGLGGEKTGSRGILDFLAEQTFGKILLGALALGLIAHVFWRMFQSFGDADDKGNDAKGIAIRVAYFFAGIIYGFLAFAAIRTLVNASSSGSGGGKSAVSMLMEKPFGKVLLMLVAAGILIKAFYDVYKVYSGKYREHIQEGKLESKKQKLLVNAGRIGFTSRALVFGIIAFLVYKAALSSNSSKAGGTGEALEFLQERFGPIIFTLVALGLICYGIFTLMEARYRRF